jgi:large subunit ribosomal protein L4
MPRQMRRLALRSALSVKAAQSSIAVLDPSDLSEPRTRVMSDLVDSVCDGRSTLVLIGERNEVLEQSIRNLPHVRYLRAGYLNVRDLLAFERLLIAEDALEAVTRHLSVEGSDEGDDDDA